LILVLPILAAVVLAGIFFILRKKNARFLPGMVLAIPLLGLTLLVGIQGGWGGGVAVLVIGAIAWSVWLLLFSGRVRTATTAFRARVWHIIFVGFFVVYALGIAMWLAAGLIAAFTGHSPALHERMHAYGGAPDILEVDAGDIAPFSIDGSRRIREMTLRANSRAQILFNNFGADPKTSCRTRCSEVEREAGVAIEHNLSIYRSAGPPVFIGTHITPMLSRNEWGELELSSTILYSFDAPGEGMYAYRCDVHPLVMRGSVRVLPASAVVTRLESPGTRDLARHIAEVSHQAEGTKEIVLDYAFSIVSLGLGVFLVLLRPRERMARVFGIAMIGTAAAYNLQSHAALATAEAFDGLHGNLHPITGITYIYALVLFPDGKLIPRFSNRLLRVGYRAAFFIAVTMFLGVTGTILPDYSQHPAALVLTFGMAIPLIGMVAQWFRIRRAPTSEARQQSRLLLLALAASFSFGVILLLALGIDIPALIRPNLSDPAALVASDARAFRVFQPLFVVIPLALFAGILRYRLWDIDLVIRRTIVYGALAGFIGATYVGVVVLLGDAVGGRTGLSIAATVLIAVAFDPLRTRLQRLANRLVYGERASPYEVMADLSHRLSGTTAPADVVRSIAEGVALGVGAVRARATLFLPSGARIHGTFPPEEEEPPVYDRTIELTHHGEPVGELAIGKRPGDALRSAENRLLEAVGSQVAIALHSLRLAERLRGRLDDLQRSTVQLDASRRRIVSAQDAERSRLERDIHERVELPLMAIGSTISAAENPSGNGDRVLETLDRAAAEANRVQDVLREVARGVFPPLLADRGVVPALESQARKTSAAVTVTATGLEERFDEHAEAAVYFCCVQAMRSAARRARDTTVEVKLTGEDAWVSFEIRDAAHGLSDAATSGADLQVMVDRIESVGGRLEIRAAPEGTTVSGRVPVQAPIAAHSAASLSGSNADFGT
jgi:signal transduction histidine kinase